MTKKKLKTVVVPLAAVAIVAAWVSVSADEARSGPPAAAVPNKVPATGLPSSTLAPDSNFPFGTDSRLDTGGMFWRMMLAVLLVAALGVAAYYASKKLGGRMVNLPGRKIRLRETFYLGSRKSLHLVEVGDKNLLIAVTPTTITAIADLGRDNQASPTTNTQE